MSPRPLPVSQAATLPASQMPPIVGEQLGRYTLLAKLATGGMAEIFVAQLGSVAGFRKKVVIKRILPHVAHDQQFTRMFLDEALTCASISHPNVCQVFELCESEETYFLVLEYLEGVTLGQMQRQALTNANPMDISLATGIITQACEGLHAAHEQVDDQGRATGLVHRDVSPGNLFVTVDGMVKLLDFGIAKSKWMSRRTRTGILLGKCEYMSPEQAQGGAVLDRRSDVFSLGILAWELLCGRRLFRRKDDYETLRAVLHAPIDPPRQIRESIPLALEKVILRALNRDTANRYQTAEDFRVALHAAAEEFGVMPRCDIATLVSTSFAASIREKRQAVMEAGRLCGPSQGSPYDEEPSAVTICSDPESTQGRTSRTELCDAATSRILPTDHAADASEEVLSATMIHSTNYPPAGASEEVLSATMIHSTEVSLGRRSPIRARPYLSIFFVSAFVIGASASIVALLSSDTKPSTPPIAPASSVAPARRTAVDNAKARTEIIEASDPEAIVTTLGRQRPPKVASGMIIIRSSQPATLYLYPDKEIIGHTPLVNYSLPVGRYKIKAKIGPGKTGRRYFELEVKSEGVTERMLTNWPGQRNHKPQSPALQSTP